MEWNYYYFISFLSNLGPGNCQLMLKHKISSIEDVRFAEKQIKLERPDITEVCVINYIFIENRYE